MKQSRFFVPTFIVGGLLLGALLIPLVKYLGQNNIIGQLTQKPSSFASGSPIMWGAYVKYPDGRQAPWDDTAWNDIETHAGKKMSIIHWGQAWQASGGTYNSFPTSLMEKVRSRGAVPMINWGSWQCCSASQPAYKLTNITRGDYDSYITTWARAAKAWGKPFFLRFDHEMNIGGEFSWNFADGVNTSADYVAMWRHVHDIFTREGVTNATWVWNPNIYFLSGSKAQPFGQAYPGDNYVDWVGLDGYNKGGWSTFSQLYADSYKVLGTLAPSKPIMLCEWSSMEAKDYTGVDDGGVKKAAWIADALQVQIPTLYPRIKAVVWWNWNTGYNFLIESSAKAQSAFATSIASDNYAANNFADITISPILPDMGGIAPTATTTPIATVIPQTVSSGAITLTPVADTYAAYDTPTVNYGSSTNLIVDGSPQERSFLKFDLTAYAGKIISSATLRIRTTTDVNSGSNDTQNIKLVNDTLWSERYMTWNNTVAVSSNILGAISATATNSSNDATLSPSLIQNNVGKLLSIAIESSGADGAIFASKESGMPAQLIITFANATPAPTAIKTPSPTPVITAAPTTTATPVMIPTMTPTPFTVSNISESDVTTSQFVVSWKTSTLSTSQIVYGTSNNSLNNETPVNSKLVSNHSVTVGGVANNTWYYYKIISVDAYGNRAVSPVLSVKTKNK